MKLTQLSLTISAVLLTSSIYAQTLPNAGTITRDLAEQRQAEALQAVSSETKIAREQDASDAIEIEVKTIRLVGVEAIGESELATLLVASQGKTVTLGQLRDVAEQITDYYHQKGFHLAKAVLPPQRIENGEVVIRVFEGKIAGVQLQNQSRLKDSLAERYLTNGIAVGKALNRTQSERALLLLRDLAGVGEVNYSLAEGENSGETLLVANLSEAPAVRGSLSQDNHGSDSTGKKRTKLNLNFNSLLGLGEQLNLQAMSSFEGLHNGRLGITLPVGTNGLSLNASLARTRYELGGAFENLQASGSSTVADMGVRYPLLRTNQHNLWLAASGEFRRLKDKVDSTATITEKRVSVANLSLNGSSQDGLLAGGLSSFNVQNSFGKLNIQSPDARAIDATSARTHGSYYKLSLNLSRTQYFTPAFSLWANVNAQWVNKNLDSGEQLGLGGLDNVAAYASAPSGDKGVIANLHLRYALNSHITASAFYDVGRVQLRHRPFTTEANSQTRQGIGVGLNVQVKGLSLEAKTAWKLNRPAGERRRPTVWLKVGYGF